MDQASVPWAQLASLLFTLIGPIALIPRFVGLTGDAPAELKRRIALVAAGVSVIAFAIAVLVGAAVMANAGTTPAALILAGGVVLLLTALKSIFPADGAAAPAAKPEPTLTTALTPLAIPTIVSPVGVAILIIFASYFPDFTDRLIILATVSVIMVINLIVMLNAHKLLKVIGMAPLLILGSVFGVLQAAMAVQMVLSGLTRAGVT